MQTSLLQSSRFFTHGPFINFLVQTSFTKTQALTIRQVPKLLSLTPTSMLKITLSYPNCSFPFLSFDLLAAPLILERPEWIFLMNLSNLPHLWTFDYFGYSYMTTFPEDGMQLEGRDFILFPIFVFSIVPGTMVFRVLNMYLFWIHWGPMYVLRPSAVITSYRD